MAQFRGTTATDHDALQHCRGRNVVVSVANSKQIYQAHDVQKVNVHH